MQFIHSKKPRKVILLAEFYKNCRELGMLVDMDYRTPFGTVDLIVLGRRNHILCGIYAQSLVLNSRVQLPHTRKATRLGRLDFPVYFLSHLYEAAPLATWIKQKHIEHRTEDELEDTLFLPGARVRSVRQIRQIRNSQPTQ